MHLRITRYFVENADWHAAQQRYADFIAQTRDAKTVFLELGIGFNTPSIIPYPFEQMTFHNPQATLIRVNRDHAEGFAQTAAQTLALRDYVADIFNIWLAA